MFISIAMRDHARSFLLQKKPRVTLLVEGDTDEELLNGILNDNEFSVISVSKYSPTGIKRKGGAKKRVIEEVAKAYSSGEEIFPPVLGFVDMDADHSQKFLRNIVEKFQRRNHIDSKTCDTILQRVKDSSLETCIFGLINQHANNGKWEWVKRISCLERKEISGTQIAEIISTAKLRSHIHGLKQDNQTITDFPHFNLFWDYTNPNQKKMERESYLENLPNFEDWMDASKMHQFPEQSLNDHCLEWTIFDFVYGNTLPSISKILSKKEIIAKQLQNEMMQGLSLPKEIERLKFFFRNMYRLK